VVATSANHVYGRFTKRIAGIRAYAAVEHALEEIPVRGPYCLDNLHAVTSHLQ
jgi:hypothetical protein